MTNNRPFVAKLCGVCHEVMHPLSEPCCPACVRPEPGNMPAAPNRKTGFNPKHFAGFVPADLPE